MVLSLSTPIITCFTDAFVTFGVKLKVFVVDNDNARNSRILVIRTHWIVIVVIKVLVSIQKKSTFFE